MSETDPQQQSASDFAREAEESQPGLIAEFIDFLRYNKAWWMVPILVVLGLVFLLAWLSGTAAAPFIYPLF